MGSPYLHFSLNRVNVVRSASGFSKLSNELLGITSSLELRGLSLVTERAIRMMLAGRRAGPHDGTHDAISDLERGDHESWKRYSWDLLLRNDIWTTFTQTYVDLCNTAVITCLARGRRVTAVATRYETEETKFFDRAVVFDFTKKGN